MAKVVVIGAGPAGMACAYRLHQGGVDVRVVEARARVGGRTWSETLANGAVAERGGEYFDSSCTEAHEFAAELGLHMVSLGFNASVRPTVDPDGPSLDDLETGSAQLCDYWKSLGDLDDSVSIGDVIAGSPLPDELKAITAARLSSGRAADVGRVSARWADGGSEMPRVAHESNTRIAEGNQRFAERMMEEIGIERVSRRWPVASLARDAGGYVVTNHLGESFAADAVVVAVPATLAPDLVDGVADPRTVSALRKVGFGQATKLHLIVESDLEPGARQEVSTPFSTWATAGVGGERAAFVTGFGATHETQDKLRVMHGPDTFRPLLEAQWAGVKFGESALLTYWGGDPWSKGAYSYRPVGWTEEDQDFIAKPGERLFFAGEHTADRHGSSITGALRSGVRASREVLEQL